MQGRIRHCLVTSACIRAQSPILTRQELNTIPRLLATSQHYPKLVYNGGSVLQQRQKSTSSGSSSQVTANGESDANEDSSKKKGKIRSIIAQYGRLGLGLYTVSYLGTLIPAYIVFRLNDNFGLDLLQVLDYLNIKERVSSFFGYSTPDDMQLKSWQVSAVFAYIVGDVTEVVRIPAVLALCPVVHRKLYNTSSNEDTNGDENSKQDAQQSHNSTNGKRD
eukprot:gb/GECG01001449.1/.p1 GENE.gb/GECG01001449.1/~~gb/GECG01001449.1/.p1  ORF type:complete len:220 (+),score=22.43 gb/GECG01001449.1/:1-660(+)